MTRDAAEDPPIIAPVLARSYVIGGTASQVATCVAPLGTGFVIGGHTTAAIDLGMGLMPHASGEDVLVAAYAADGTLRWARTVGSLGDDGAFDITTDTSGNTYVTGHAQGPIDFGGGVRSAVGGDDIFIASFAPDGTHRWSRILGSAGNGDFGFGVTTSGDSVFLTGWFFGPTNFGDAMRTPVDHQDAYVLAMSPQDGTTQYSRSYGGTALDQGQKLALGAGDRMALIGLFAGTADFGGGVATSAGGHDIFIAVTDSAGAPQWARTGGATGSDRGHDVGFGPDGELYVCGAFTDRLELANVASTSAGNEDGYVARLSADGNGEWMQTIAGSDVDQLAACRVGPDRSILVAGTFQSPTLQLGEQTFANAGSVDIALAAYSRSGQLAWARHYGTAGVENVRDVAIDQTGVIYAAGLIGAPIDFGDGVRTPTGTDGFVLRLVPP